MSETISPPSAAPAATVTTSVAGAPAPAHGFAVLLTAMMADAAGQADAVAVEADLPDAPDPDDASSEAGAEAAPVVATIVPATVARLVPGATGQPVSAEPPPTEGVAGTGAPAPTAAEGAGPTPDPAAAPVPAPPSAEAPRAPAAAPVPGGAATAAGPAAAGGGEPPAPPASAGRDDTGSPAGAARPAEPPAPVGTTPTAPASGDPAAPPADPTVTARPADTGSLHARAVGRVMDALDLLENAPPPRRMTVELPDAEGLRLQVALRGGEVHVSVLGGGGTSHELAGWNRDLTTALAARGLQLGTFDTGTGDPRDRPSRDPDAPSQPPAPPAAQQPRRHPTTDQGLRL
jgi:hypothetical protein